MIKTENQLRVEKTKTKKIFEKIHTTQHTDTEVPLGLREQISVHRTELVPYRTCLLKTLHTSSPLFLPNKARV